MSVNKGTNVTVSKGINAFGKARTKVLQVLNACGISAYEWALHWQRVSTQQENAHGSPLKLHLK
eukprot:1140989-Pelagomonas_calceolata.AAC.3